MSMTELKINFSLEIQPHTTAPIYRQAFSAHQKAQESFVADKERGASARNNSPVCESV